MTPHSESIKLTAVFKDKKTADYYVGQKSPKGKQLVVTTLEEQVSLKAGDKEYVLKKAKGKSYYQGKCNGITVRITLYFRAGTITYWYPRSWK